MTTQLKCIGRDNPSEFSMQSWKNEMKLCQGLLKSV